MEIEAKFSILDPATHIYLTQLTHLGEFALATAEQHVVEVQDTYIDTPDWKILAAGYSCRQRQYENDRLRISIKSLRTKRSSIHRREEYEVKLKKALPPKKWPSSTARRRVLKLTAGEPLEPLFTLHQRRTIRPILHRQQEIAALSIDEVSLIHGARHQHYYEVEVELRGPGAEADLHAIVAYLARINGLATQPLSKFERGLAFVQARRPLPEAAPVAATPRQPRAPGISPRDTLRDAALKVLRAQFEQMVANESGTRSGGDSEALHDMRVATRRMRTVFRVFEAHLDMSEMAYFLKTIKRTNRVLGNVRDMDVFWQETQAYLDGFPPDDCPNLAPLAHGWSIDYRNARAKLLKHLDSGKYRSFREEFRAYLETRPPAPPPRKDALPARVQDRLPGIIYNLLAEVKSYAQALDRPHAALEQYHDLRIAAKRLRYVLEFFAEPLGPEVKPAIKELKLLQNHLGALQDAAVACERIDNYLTWGSWKAPKKRRHPDRGRGPIVAPGVSAYLQVRQAEIDTLIETYPAVWATFAESSFSQRLNAAIAAL